MPVMRKAHHNQFMLTPPFRTRSVTRFGVSVEKVVATIEVPSSHQGRLRPERKYCSRFAARALCKEQADHERDRTVGDHDDPVDPFKLHDAG